MYIYDIIASKGTPANPWALCRKGYVVVPMYRTSVTVRIRAARYVSLQRAFSREFFLTKVTLVRCGVDASCMSFSHMSLNVAGEHWISGASSPHAPNLDICGIVLEMRALQVHG